GLAAVAVPLATPIVRDATWLAWLPDAIEAYLRPVRGLTTFAFFPWAGFVFAGSLVGLALDSAPSAAAESRANAGIFAAGLATTIAAYAASFAPRPYRHSSFWTSSPLFFFLRTGLVAMALALAYWRGLAARRDRWSPIEQLGRNSLFIYWIHVELVYGLVSLKLHNGLTLGAAWLALVAFSLSMV